MRVGDLCPVIDAGVGIRPVFRELEPAPPFAESSLGALVSNCGCTRLWPPGDGDLLPGSEGEVIVLLMGDLLLGITRDRETLFDIF